MIANNPKHEMEKVAQGDEAHIKVMEAKRHYNDPAVVQRFMEKFPRDFAAQQEDT